MKAIVRFNRRRAIREFLKRKKQCILPDITGYPTVALLLDGEQFNRHKEIEATMNRLFNLKRLTFVTCVNTQSQDVLQSDRHFYINNDDFNFWGLLKKDKKESLNCLSFDMMVDMVHVGDDMLMNQYIMSLINNTFRVTFGHQCTSFYDLVIDSKKEDDVLKRIEILHDYLSMLLGKR